MSSRKERVSAAAAGLKNAVFKLPDGERPLNVGLAVDFWRSVGKASIANWVDDAERASLRIARALDTADSDGDGEKAIDELETALWSVTAAREKLEAVFSLAFGVPALKPYGESSLCFEPNTAAIKAKLRELARSHDAARELGEAGLRLAEHPAVLLRDQLTHQIAAISDAAELCWIDVAHMRGNGIIGWSGGPFYAQGVLDQGPITHEALWTRAVVGVRECFDLLVRCFELMADLVRAAAVLEPPQRIFKHEDTGEVWTRDPRSQQA